MGIYSPLNSNLSRNGIASSSTTVRRANLSVLATAEFRGGQMVSTPINRQRYVWPNPYNQVQSASVLTRKAFAR